MGAPTPTDLPPVGKLCKRCPVYSSFPSNFIYVKRLPVPPPVTTPSPVPSSSATTSTAAASSRSGPRPTAGTSTRETREIQSSHGLTIFRTLPDLMAVSVSCTDTKMWEGNDEKKKFIGGLVLFRLCYPEVEGDACLVFDQQIDPRYMHHMLVGLAKPIKLLSKNK